MSMKSPMAGVADTGQAVTTVRDYEAAQKTVSRLIAAEVPARDITIIGIGVRTVERVTGRLGYATAARSGAINGVLIGLFLAAIMVLGNPEAPIQLFLGFLLIGVAVGMLLSILTFWMVRRRRDYASVMQLAADTYEIRVQPSSLGAARNALGTQAARPAAPVIDLSVPPRYGERISQPPASTIDPNPAADPAPPSESGTPVASPPPPASAPPATGSDEEPPRYGERLSPGPDGA